MKTLDQLQQKCVLLAPTGRAAKVFSHYAQHPAYTIHKKIYRQRNFSNDLDNFSLDDNLHQHTLFIVDEASMIANDGLAGAVFGTGRLLDDLIQYVYAGTGCRLMPIGDTAQLLRWERRRVRLFRPISYAGMAWKYMRRSSLRWSVRCMIRGFFGMRQNCAATYPRKFSHFAFCPCGRVSGYPDGFW